MSNTKKLTTLAMLSAMAFAIMVVGRIPVVMFLKYDPKDIIIAISGFIYGPLSAIGVSSIVSLVEMFTVSDNGIIGMLMNIISTCAFVCPAIIYRKKHNIKGALIGLIVGCFVMVVTMLIWNYIMTPLYMGVPRAAVIEILFPVILPFNLLKGGLNVGATMLVYKPMVTALRNANLIENEDSIKVNNNKGITILSLIILITCILFVLSWKGII